MRRLVAVLGVVSALLVGCGSDIEGTPLAGERWDPCSITPEAIQAAGLDPEYREIGWGEGITVSDWGRCVFKPPVKSTPYFLSAKSSFVHTIEEARGDEFNLDGQSLEVGGHEAYQYRTEVGRTGRSCDITVSLPPGVAVFSVIDMSEMPNARLCELVLQHTNSLSSSLPKSN